MPCACRAPIETYPENAAWGPLFWKLLHGLAEHTGKQRDPMTQTDERRTWMTLLKSLQETLPCDVCRNHYAGWLKENPTDDILTIPYVQVNPWIRDWLWRLHNRVNDGNDKVMISFDQVSALHRGVDITKTWKQMEPVMRRAIVLSGISLIPWKKFLGEVRKLQGLYN